MSLDERKQMWQQRINAYKSSGETSVKAWCKQNQVGLQSMYSWMKRLDVEATPVAFSPTQWVAIDSSSPFEESSTLTVKIGDVSIEIKEGFNQALFNEVLQILQSNVK